MENSSILKQTEIDDGSYIVTKEEVLKEIKACKRFGWSWSEDLEAVHHTAILFILDDVPRYTINWTPKNDAKKKSILNETKGKLVFEDERLKSYNVSYNSCLQEYDIEEETDHNGKFKEKFNNILTELMSFRFTSYENYDKNGNAKYYDLTSCNCRDHVISVMEQVHSLTGDEKLLSKIKSVKGETKTGAEPTAVKASVVGLTLIPFYAVFSGSTFNRFMNRQFGRLFKKLKPGV